MSEDHKVQIEMRGKPYTLSDGTVFQAGTIQVVSSTLARELVSAQIANTLVDPFFATGEEAPQVKVVDAEIPASEPVVELITEADFAEGEEAEALIESELKEP